MQVMFFVQILLYGQQNCSVSSRRLHIKIFKNFAIFHLWHTSNIYQTAYILGQSFLFLILLFSCNSHVFPNLKVLFHVLKHYSSISSKVSPSPKCSFLGLTFLITVHSEDIIIVYTTSLYIHSVQAVIKCRFISSKAKYSLSISSD